MTSQLRKVLLDPWFQAGAIGMLAFGVYLRTLAPTVMWYDMGEFQTAAYVLGIAHNTGYPLLLLLGKLFTFLPFGDVAYRVNLMSATFGALTVLMLYAIVYQVMARRTPSAIAALTLATSSTLWSNATWATSYDLNAFLTLLTIWLMLRWRVYAESRYLNLAALTFGLGLGNHHLIIGAGAAAAYLAWRGGVQLRSAWRPALTFLVGFSVNLYLPLRAAQHPLVMWDDPSRPEVFLRMITTGYARAFVNPFESLANLRSVLAVLRLFPVYELTIAGLLLAAVGAWRLWHRDRQLLVASGVIVALATAMISIYGIHNIFNYFQPIYLVLAIWLGIGAGVVLEIAARLGQGLGLSLLTESRRVGLATALLLGLPLILFGRSFPILDRSLEFDARDYARYLLTTVEPDAVILADFWSWAPLRYLQVVDGIRPDVSVTNLLSQPGLDQQAVVADLLRGGAAVYVALGIDDSPRLRLDKSQLQLIAPYVIDYYPTSTLPLPEFKDLLVPKGAVYRAVTASPELEVAQAPAGQELQAQFGEQLTLTGFGIQPLWLAPGDRFTADYIWRLSEPTDADYWVDIQFTDAEESVPARLGIPIWLHSHWIGSEARPTSSWAPGQLMREVYDGLVPNRVPPGRYFVWATVYTDPSHRELIGDPRGVVLGTIEVVAP